MVFKPSFTGSLGTDTHMGDACPNPFTHFLPQLQVPIACRVICAQTGACPYGPLFPDYWGSSLFPKPERSIQSREPSLQQRESIQNATADFVQRSTY